MKKAIIVGTLLLLLLLSGCDEVAEIKNKCWKACEKLNFEYLAYESLMGLGGDRYSKCMCIKATEPITLWEWDYNK